MVTHAQCQHPALIGRRRLLTNLHGQNINKRLTSVTQTSSPQVLPVLLKLNYCSFSYLTHEKENNKPNANLNTELAKNIFCGFLA